MDPHAGTIQNSGASLECEPCLKGEYQDLTGQQSCKRCDVTDYQDEEGGAICKKHLGNIFVRYISFFFTICREFTACCVFELLACHCFSRRHLKYPKVQTRSNKCYKKCTHRNIVYSIDLTMPHLPPRCPANSRTLQRGSLSFTACGCEVGYINVANVTLGLVAR